jgi:purine-binding chemotaxis protein CheW
MRHSRWREVVLAEPRIATGLNNWRRELQETLREDVGELEPASATAAASSGRIEVLAFRLGSERYAVDIREVVEIIMPRAIAPIPRATGFVKGMASHRGSVLPVSDLAGRLGLEPSQRSKASRILVLRDQEDQVGFWVDEVHGVLRFAEEEVEVSGFAGTVDPRFVRGIAYDSRREPVAVLLAERLSDFDMEER